MWCSGPIVLSFVFAVHRAIYHKHVQLVFWRTTACKAKFCLNIAESLVHELTVKEQSAPAASAQPQLQEQLPGDQEQSPAQLQEQLPGDQEEYEGDEDGEGNRALSQALSSQINSVVRHIPPAMNEQGTPTVTINGIVKALLERRDRQRREHTGPYARPAPLPPKSKAVPALPPASKAMPAQPRPFARR
jgi:hypothetical protein